MGESIELDRGAGNFHRANYFLHRVPDAAKKNTGKTRAASGLEI